MLNLDPNKRIPASEALKHPWLTSFCENTKVSDKELLASLNNLHNFRLTMMFQKAVLTYLSSQKLSQKEENKIKTLFDIFDTNKDGQLTKPELIAGYKSLHGDSKRAKKEAKAILKNIDLNNTGIIEYNGILN